jgi:hypothetical protein
MLELQAAHRSSGRPVDDDEDALRALLLQRRAEVAAGNVVDGPAAMAEIRSRLFPARR